MTADFLDRLRAKLDIKGEQTRLAEAIGSDPSGVSRLKDQDAGSWSRLVAPICIYYGWPPPETGAEADRAALLGKWVDLGSTIRDAGKLQEALEKVASWWEIEGPAEPDDED